MPVVALIASPTWPLMALITPLAGARSVAPSRLFWAALTAAWAVATAAWAEATWLGFEVDWTFS